MPILSLFYGIIIRMYKEVSGKHHKPHIHVEYAEEEVVWKLLSNGEEYFKIDPLK